MRQTLTLKASREAIPFISFRDDGRVKITDYPTIRSISPFHAVTTVGCAIIAFQFVPDPAAAAAAGEKEKGGEEKKKGKVGKSAHTPAAIANDLNARETPEWNADVRVSTAARTI